MGHGLTIDPAQITADTQLLRNATPRRFLSSLWELQGRALAVTPAVARELANNVGAAAERRWQNLLEHDRRDQNRHYDDVVYRRILEGARDAATAWIREELRQPGGITEVLRTAEHDQAALAIARAMPAVCFTPTTSENERNDRLIVGEAAAYGFRLLASENLASIRHGHVNSWLERQGHVSGPLVVRLEDAMPARSRDPRDLDDAAFAAVPGAALPGAEGSLERDRQAIERFIDVLKRGHAGACGRWAESREPPQDLPCARAVLHAHARSVPPSLPCRRRGHPAPAQGPAAYPENRARGHAAGAATRGMRRGTARGAKTAAPCRRTAACGQALGLRVLTSGGRSAASPRARAGRRRSRPPGAPRRD